jgi:transcriptional regulator with XRE-family HTH domain
MTIGDRIRRRRQEIGISQQELSDMTGVRRATISDLESGKRTGMTLDTAKALARALGVSIDYLADTWGEGEESQLPPASVALVSA